MMFLPPDFLPTTPMGAMIAKLNRNIRQLRPQKAPGVLTSVGTHGTMRRALPIVTRQAGPSAPLGVQLVYLQSVGTAILNCSSLPNGGGSVVQVAKATKLNHRIPSEVIEGATITYAYATRPNNLDGQRSATDPSGLTQIEIVLPVYIVNDPIIAVTVSNPTGGNSIVIDANIDGRAWCQVG